MSQPPKKKSTLKIPSFTNNHFHSQHNLQKPKMAPVVDQASLDALSSQVDSCLAITSQLATTLGDIYKNPSSTFTAATTSTSTLDAVALSRDASNLAKAQATKISLLIINEPFTPSAITTVVRELAAGPVPAIAAAVQACDPALYTNVFRKEMAWRCQRLLKEIVELVSKIPKNGQVVAEKDRKGFSKQKGSLASTGLLWSAADDVVKLANIGVAGYFIQKINTWRDTLQDVLEELKEWSEQEPDAETDRSEAFSDDDDDDDIDDAQKLVDDLMNSQKTIPEDDPDGIRPRVESTLRRLRLTLHLYQAISKRRLSKLLQVLPSDTAADSDIPKRLDDASVILDRLPDNFSDLATQFYDLDNEGIDSGMSQCFADSSAAGESFSKNWQDETDEFSTWVEKFHAEMTKE
ncbi:hypothetical protein VHEMI00026 [[Torrubiella] hemipterigena]|uniref:Cyclin-D1-binding protein 1-like N-terminal domain-containing protein n=1 Tax=[Torrubiella] hemipterigena TaxID=1531966 RepID=A0A0A1SP91_9HYPO|nr:hypothetical protein VHEMI00026 [[Torrubiella] hemipterigena]